MSVQNLKRCVKMKDISPTCTCNGSQHTIPSTSHRELHVHTQVFRLHFIDLHAPCYMHLAISLDRVLLNLLVKWYNTCSMAGTVCSRQQVHWCSDPKLAHQQAERETPLQGWSHWTGRRER